MKRNNNRSKGESARLRQVVKQIKHLRVLFVFCTIPHLRSITVNRRLHCAGRHAVIASKDAVCALKSHPKVAILLNTHA
jgi:hypothetical protein